ncbi:hypothetical protein R5R35_001287 [Gryllus longicercus]|uniref:Alkaline phosphatase n=1 Tax=Gryllus longicercus TaxID=2509291 RepID=A0AAN9VS64_9ORTH
MCKFLIACLLLPVAVSSALKEDKAYWATQTQIELDEALKLTRNENRAKNVILFVGDGMGPNTITAARIFKGNGNEQTKLTFDEFPHIGLLKTYCADKQVPDSASTATALFCGVKGNYHTAGVDANVPEGDCQASQNPEYWVPSIIQWAQDAGKDTGFVTTTRVTHATPSALYAHSPDRNWECEAKLPSSAQGCKDIARQLIENEPGKNIKVIMGGGRQCLVSNATGDASDPLDIWACQSKDGRNLIKAWQQDKQSRNFSSAYLKTNEDLWNVDVAKTDFVLGIFANGHLGYENEHIDRRPTGMPTLKNMTSVAIQLLKKNPKGFLLVVEGGLIDFAHHRGVAKHALYETVAMDDAIAAALNLTTQDSDTLIIVTSDHSHGLSMTGYPKRGADILGLAGTSKMDHTPYTTLSYTTGDNDSFKFSVTEEGTIVRDDPTKEAFSSFDYHQHTGILTDEVLHGGSDVAVYAKGPMAHLFHSVHEQTYVAHVIAYAAKIGPYSSASSFYSFSATAIVLFSFFVFYILC